MWWKVQQGRNTITKDPVNRTGGKAFLTAASNFGKANSEEFKNPSMSTPLLNINRERHTEEREKNELGVGASMAAHLKKTNKETHKEERERARLGEGKK